MQSNNVWVLADFEDFDLSADLSSFDLSEIVMLYLFDSNLGPTVQFCSEINSPILSTTKFLFDLILCFEIFLL